tara:strand:- start:1146 stop:1340 length:195 start_codon:yes stop_codon:yes gene_type:complete
LLETTVPLLAMIGTGLVSSGLVLLLMTLGMPDKKEECITYFDEIDPEKWKKTYKKILTKIENDK